MMMQGDALAGTEIRDFLPHRDHDSRGFMAEHEGRLGPDVPIHDVAGADPAGGDFDQDIPCPDGRHRSSLKADIIEIMDHGHRHVSGQRGHGMSRISAYLSPSPAIV